MVTCGAAVCMFGMYDKYDRSDMVRHCCSSTLLISAHSYSYFFMHTRYGKERKSISDKV